MTHVSVQEMQADPAAFLQKIRQGEELVFEEDGVPLGHFIPTPMNRAQVEQGAAIRTPAQGLGFLKGQMDGSLDVKGPFAADIEEMFYGNPDKFR